MKKKKSMKKRWRREKKSYSLNIQKQPVEETKAHPLTIPKEYKDLQTLAETNTKIIVRPPFQWFDSKFYPILQADESIVYYPSVTTILDVAPKPFLARLRGDIGNEEMDRRITEAVDRGSRVHHACYEYARGGIVIFDQKPWLPRYVWKPEEIEELSKELMPDSRIVILRDQNEFWQVEKWAEWLYRTRARLIFAELTVISSEYEYAGTLDYLLEHDEGEFYVAGSEPLWIAGGLNIWDIKTGYPRPEYVLQIAAYYHALKEQLPRLNLMGGGIIYTDVDTKKGIEGLKTQYYSARELEEKFSLFLSHFEVWKYHNPNLQPTVRELEPILSISRYKAKKQKEES